MYMLDPRKGPKLIHIGTFSMWKKSDKKRYSKIKLHALFNTDSKGLFVILQIIIMFVFNKLNIVEVKIPLICNVVSKNNTNECNWIMWKYLRKPLKNEKSVNEN